MSQDISRRRFLAASAAVTAGASALASRADAAPTQEGQPGNFHLFVVSDSHFGWDSPDQPSPEHQAQAIAGIMQGHPNLDLFVDSGDVHHNSAPDSAREDWTDVIGNGIGPVPLMLCNGNHDGMVWGGGVNPEDRCARLGSQPARPYFSMDIKGIHIVSLPQMIWMSYSPEESLEWLELDLDAAQRRTTIIISHNSLVGTTRDHGDIGYRQLANSPAVHALLRRYPNVVAWMHGHNHSYESMEVGGRLYISNGRIGGFDPTWNRERLEGDNLGGIHLEVTPEAVIAKAYSGIQKSVMENFTDNGEAAQVLRVRTSLDPSAPASLCWGFGKAAPGIREQARRHWIGAPDAAPAEVLRRPASVPHINEDPRFATYAQRVSRTHRTKHLGGFNISPDITTVAREDATWGWLNPGISFNAVDRPRVVSTSCNSSGRASYFRVHPASAFTLGAALWCEKPGARARLRAKLIDTNGRELAAWAGEEVPLPAGDFQLRGDFAFDLPALPGIYADPASEDSCQLVAELEIADIGDFIDVRAFELLQQRNGVDTTGVLVDGAPVALGQGPAGAQRGLVPAPLDGRSRHVVEVGAADTRPQNVLVREHGLEWQVRNAVARRDGAKIVVESIRNPYSRGKAVLIAPMRRTSVPFVARTEGLDSFIVTPHTEGDGLLVEVGPGASGKVLVANAGADPRIEGGSVAGMVGGLLAIEVAGPATMRLRPAAS